MAYTRAQIEAMPLEFANVRLPDLAAPGGGSYVVNVYKGPNGEWLQFDPKRGVYRVAPATPDYEAAPFGSWSKAL